MANKSPHTIEQAVGLDWYITDPPGLAGQIRTHPRDFRVREQEAIDPEPMAADADAYPHVVFRATLRGYETNAFADTLANQLGISRERISWAGTKDKQAVTTQLFSVAHGDPAAIAEVTMADVDIEILGRLGRAIEFGDLRGNDFTITLRSPAGDPDTVVSRVATVSEQLRTFGGGTVGLPNYFGQQRFGSRRPITHRVGLAIIRENWKTAVRRYVTESFAAESESTATARGLAADQFDDTDWKGVLETLPRRLNYERTLVHTLVDGGTFREALEALPYSLQQLFVHAAQSYIFNQIISRRIEQGLPFDRPVAGDVVCFADSTDTPARPDVHRTQRVTEDRVETVTRHCKRGRAFITAPLVGTDTDYADGAPGEIEQAVLAEFDIGPDAFALPGEWASTGTRRAILVQTALETTVDEETVTFEFALPKGGYATVLLREYRKTAPGPAN